MPQPGRDLVRYRCVYGHPVQTLNINYVKRTANIYGILYNPIFITYIYINIPSTQYLAGVYHVPCKGLPSTLQGVPSTLQGCTQYVTPQRVPLIIELAILYISNNQYLWKTWRTITCLIGILKSARGSAELKNIIILLQHMPIQPFFSFFGIFLIFRTFLLWLKVGLQKYECRSCYKWKKKEKSAMSDSQWYL